MNFGKVFYNFFSFAKDDTSFSFQQKNSTKFYVGNTGSEFDNDICFVIASLPVTNSCASLPILQPIILTFFMNVLWERRFFIVNFLSGQLCLIPPSWASRFVSSRKTVFRSASLDSRLYQYALCVPSLFVRVAVLGDIYAFQRQLVRYSTRARHVGLFPLMVLTKSTWPFPVFPSCMSPRPIGADLTAE